MDKIRLFIQSRKNEVYMDTAEIRQKIEELEAKLNSFRGSL
jgi:hypothetical protein